MVHLWYSETSTCEGLIWRSRVISNGYRRVNCYCKHLMQDVDGNPHQALQWLVEYGNPVMMLGPQSSNIKQPFFLFFSFLWRIEHKNLSYYVGCYTQFEDLRHSPWTQGLTKFRRTWWHASPAHPRLDHFNPSDSFQSTSFLCAEV